MLLGSCRELEPIGAQQVLKVGRDTANGPVAQLDRALGSHLRGCEFESHRGLSRDYD